MEKTKYTEKELLELAGQMAIAARQLLECPVQYSGEYIENLAHTLNKYDCAIFSNLK